MDKFRDVFINENKLQDLGKWMVSKSSILGKLAVEAQKGHGQHLPFKVVSIEYYGDKIASGYDFAMVSSRKNDNLMGVLFNENEKVKKGDQIILAGPITILKKDDVNIYFGRKT